MKSLQFQSPLGKKGPLLRPAGALLEAAGQDMDPERPAKRLWPLWTYLSRSPDGW